MSIEVGSKWQHEDSGEVVEISDSFLYKNAFYVIDYKHSDEQHSLLTQGDFLEQYKPYEPVYEYMFMYQLDDNVKGEWNTHPSYYKTLDDCMNYTTRNAYNFQRLDFTKRERK